MRALEALEAYDTLRMANAVSLGQPVSKKQSGDRQAAMEKLQRRINDLVGPERPKADGWAQLRRKAKGV